MGFCFVVDDLGVVGVLAGQLEKLPILGYYLAMGPIVQLSANVVFDQHVDLLFGVQRENEELLFRVVLNGTILPVDLVLLPQFLEGLEPDSLFILCVLLQDLLECTMVKDFPNHSEEGF